MVIASASSGPAMSAVIGGGAVMLWRLRGYTRAFRWSLVAAYFGLMLVMERPPYYIIQRLEVVGGSTGWYRSHLIDVAIERLDEWWLAGTDYTRHWMFGNAVSENHIDITSHYLSLGVIGGLPLLFLHIGILSAGYSLVGRAMVRRADAAGWNREQAMIWALGCALLAHTVTCISVSYFDQSVMFMYLTLAAIGSMYAAPQEGTVAQPQRSHAPASARTPGGPAGWRPGAPFNPAYRVQPRHRSLHGR
jgi:hypothetical protein